jgi:hypothetical protein
MRLSAVQAFAPILAGTIGAACGSLDGHTNSPSVLATVQGQLSTTPGSPTIPDSPTMPDHVHIAVIWQTAVPGQFNVAEDLPVQPVFPFQYVLQLTEPPPTSTITHPAGHPEFSAAYGVLVAYEDLNGDGMLDLVPDDAGAFIDRVVATNPTLALVYLDSSTGSFPSLPNTVGGTPTLGYNLLTQDCAPLDGSLMGPDGGYCDWNVFLPVSTTPYNMSFSSDATLNSLMCQTYGSGGGSSATGSLWNVNTAGPPPGGYPAPGAPGLTCSADGASYTTQACQTVSMGLCASEQACIDEQVALGGGPRPAGWPCP